MKTIFFYWLTGVFLVLISNAYAVNQVVRVNQLGYLPKRKDKFYRILEDLIRDFSSREYQFEPINK